MNALILGGNEKFSDFMSEYDLFTEIKDKYNSIPAEHYRKHIINKDGVPALRIKL